ncbi:hypothetical protein HR45_12915 [Shewanella mangrovi]|uniref:Uncharacterized protein n=1 Tax=Shewanella mangrovi TaxID=1515746 RepID=A0A094JAM4_9GAMM|nr:hypothetical protein [Shewanella mangrovi]KFZ36945.1 hypothetical protein HR45_12915 [Shewanella mangrovi]
MTNALINFVAKLGSDITLQDPQALVQAAQAASLTEEQITALLNKETTTLAGKLNIRTEIVCMMLPAEDEPQPGEKPEEDEDAEKDASIKVA